MPRLFSMKALCALLDVSETTVRRLVSRGHLPPPKKVAGRVPRWTLGQIKGYLYALENDLLPPVPDEAAEACQEKKRPPRGTQKPLKPPSGPPGEGD